MLIVVNQEMVLPETADADSSTAEREMMNPSNSRVTQPRICFMQIECINNIAMRF
jgi:hypothetical protein